MTKVHHILTNKDIPVGAVFLTDPDTQKRIEERMAKPYYCWGYEMNENGAFDIPIGETVAYNEVTLKVVLDNGNGCNACYFKPDNDYICCRFGCTSYDRKDGESVIFEEVKDDKTN